MKIEKIPEGYILARKGGNGCELWRTFNGAESFACEAIDELLAERDALRVKIGRMEKIESAAQNLVKMKGRHNTEIAYRRLVATLEESK